ncbi:HEPN domain-containing protein [uncultured Alistipes sp.]|uniref:HEPN domain-containing protein n=1 Tax=uncultured Alistipes sp. TaxID=538949 RepID=UPI002591A8C8|nr:HEPN domain-containing protein [uncultured Alistipes sp.]
MIDLQKKKSEQKIKGKVADDGENPQVDSMDAQHSDLTKILSPLDIFEKCIKRAENLISLQEKAAAIAEISDGHYCDCYRAAVVLTISALDAFVRTMVISEIRKILMDTKQKLPIKLADYLKNLLSQDKLLEAARNSDLLERVESAVRTDFETKSFQGEWKISSYLEMVGYKDIFAEVALNADINERNLKQKLSLYTTRRHVIAHSGDYDLNSTPHSENTMNKKYASDCVDLIRLFARTIHEISNNKQQ